MSKKLYRTSVDVIRDASDEDGIFHITAYLVAENPMTAIEEAKEVYYMQTKLATMDLDVVHIEAEEVKDKAIIPQQVIPTS